MLRSWKFFYLENEPSETSLAVQWLRLHVAKAGDVGLILGWRTKIPHAMWHGKKKRGGVFREFPGSPVVRTPHSHSRGLGFNPWLEN